MTTGKTPSHYAIVLKNVHAKCYNSSVRADVEIEPLDIIDALDMDFCLGNALKYLLRAGRKEGQTKRADLEKLKHYAELAIARLGEALLVQKSQVDNLSKEQIAEIIKEANKAPLMILHGDGDGDEKEKTKELIEVTAVKDRLANDLSERERQLVEAVKHGKGLAEETRRRSIGQMRPTSVVEAVRYFEGFDARHLIDPQKTTGTFEPSNLDIGDEKEKTNPSTIETPLSERALENTIIALQCAENGVDVTTDQIERVRTLEEIGEAAGAKPGERNTTGYKLSLTPAAREVVREMRNTGDGDSDLDLVEDPGLDPNSDYNQGLLDEKFVLIDLADEKHVLVLTTLSVERLNSLTLSKARLYDTKEAVIRDCIRIGDRARRFGDVRKLVNENKITHAAFELP